MVGACHSSPSTWWARNANTVWYQTFTCWGVRIQWFSSWITNVGVAIASACRLGELTAVISGVISRSQYQAASVVGPNWSSDHRPAWLTIARNRSVWPAIQLAMYPPKEPPIAAV